ncbi:MAG TPA: DnaB-like helicase N-terminal domain-containing protein, partial [Anaerolineae bacterium]
MNKIPYSTEAEAAVIGAMLLSRDAADDVAGVLRSAADFFQQRHVTIFDAVMALHAKGAAIDMVMVREALADRGVLDQVGGVAYLVELAESTPAIGAATHYARIVRDKAITRDVIEASHKTLDQIQQPGDVDLDAAL